MAGFEFTNGDEQVKDAVAANIKAAQPPAAPIAIPLSTQPPPPSLAKVTPQTAYLQDLLNNVATVSQEIAAGQAVRATQMSQQTEQSMKEIDQANINLNTKANSFFATLIEDFDSDYSARTQKNRINAAMRQMRVLQTHATATNTADKLKLDAAKAPLEVIKAIRSTRKGDLDMKISELQLITQNASLQKSMTELRQSQSTFADAKHAVATGEFTADMTEAFAVQKLADQRTMLDELETASDARVLGKLKLADAQENRALEKMAIGDLRAVSAGAKQLGMTELNLGGGKSLPLHKMKARLAELETAEFEHEKALATRMVELDQFATRDTAVIDDAISTAVTTVAGSQRVDLPTSTELLNMPEEALAQLDLFNKMPTAVAAATYDVLSAKQRLDEQLATKNVDAAAMLIYNKKIETLQAATKQHTDDFIAGVSKKRQPAFRRLVSNNMVVDNPNQGAQILAETGLQLPDFRGSEALRKGFQQFVLQFGEQKGVSGKVSALEDSPEAQDKLVNDLMAKFSFGSLMKETDFTEVLKAVNVRPTDGTFSVKETILSEQFGKMFYSSMLELGQQHPDVQQLLFSANGMQTDVWFDGNRQVSISQIAEALVELGATKNQDASFYVQPLGDSVNKTMLANKPQMETFTAPNAQSFMKMVFPFEDFHTLVDRDLEMELSAALSRALQKQQVETRKAEIHIEPYNIY